MPILLAPTLIQRPAERDQGMMDRLRFLFDAPTRERIAAFSMRLHLSLDDDLDGKPPTASMINAVGHPTSPSFAPRVAPRDLHHIQGILRTRSLNTDILFVSHTKGEPAFAVFTPGCIALQTYDVVGYARAAKARLLQHGPTYTVSAYPLATLRMDEARSAHHALAQQQDQAFALACLLRARPAMAEAMAILDASFPMASLDRRETESGACMTDTR